jgi:hypothetical protein
MFSVDTTCVHLLWCAHIYSSCLNYWWLLDCPVKQFTGQLYSVLIMNPAGYI